MSRDRNSFQSIIEATESRAHFSGHGKALGAAGHRERSEGPGNSTFLRDPGQSLSISPPETGFKNFTISASWDSRETSRKGLLGKLIKAPKLQPVDIDLGCLYELQDGTRGAIQAFGDKFGAFNDAPYIALSQDERDGRRAGPDEWLTVNGQFWVSVRRMLVYLYIYRGASRWSQVKPRVDIDIPGQEDLIVTLGAHDDSLSLCAVGGLENVRNGIKLTNYTEYFPGHLEMDRAFGFGLNWDEGTKE